ncbi:MAG TPA: AarF/UbiB family protein, partial [Thermoanaerobaculia bacterium]|nr:AarF/UbiB family protein [Thermoanaerobaculia bacterium]
GIKVDEIPAIARIDYDFSILAEEFAKAYLHQITVTGHFHADPHPGNIFVVLPDRVNPLTPAETVAMNRRETEREAVTPLTKIEKEAQAENVVAPPKEDPKLALIDFGMTAHISDKMKDKVIRLLLSMADHNGDAAAETLIEMGEVTEDFNRNSFVRDSAALIAANTDQTVGDTSAGLILYQLITIAFRQGLKLPAELTLLAKALFNLDAITRALDPQFNPTQAIREYTSEIATKRARRDLSPQRLFQIATETVDLVRALPHRIDIMTQKMASDDFAVRVDVPALMPVMKGMEKIANRIFTGLVLGGLLVASGLLLQYQRRLGTIGFVVAAAIGLYMILTILITDRKTKKREH